MPMHGAPLFGRGLSVDLTVSRHDATVESPDIAQPHTEAQPDLDGAPPRARPSRPHKRAWAPDPPERSDSQTRRRHADRTSDPINMDHRARPAPLDHLCTCGHLREVCVSQEVRALWRLITNPSPPAPPKG